MDYLESVPGDWRSGRPSGRLEVLFVLLLDVPIVLGVVVELVASEDEFISEKTLPGLYRGS